MLLAHGHVARGWLLHLTGVLCTVCSVAIVMVIVMSLVIKHVFLDALVLTNMEFYIILAICFVLGFPVGMVIGHYAGKLIRRIWK